LYSHLDWPQKASEWPSSPPFFHIEHDRR
jgi:hypothetical protein